MPFSRNKIMPLARRLLAAKQRYPAKQAFGKWLRGSTYASIGKNDRAALINIGKHAEISRIVLRQTTSRSVRLIWLNEVRGVAGRLRFNNPGRRKFNNLVFPARDAAPRPQRVRGERRRPPKGLFPA